MKLALLASLLVSTVFAAELYTVRDVSGAGTLTLTANKDYNIWDNSGNRTTYTIDIVSPLIRSTSQEIRVAIQWQWKTRLGISNERVAFYGEVSKQRFDQYRVDRHIEVNGSYQFSNWFLPVIPKDSSTMPPQKPEDAEKYIIRQADDPEISVDNRTARFSFTVNRDEPYSDDNRIWVNWGIFDSPYDTDQDKVQGSREAQSYDIFLTYSDYFDRVFINGLYWTIGLTGLTFWFALPLQVVPMLALVIYAYWVPISIIIAPPSQNFTFDNFFLEVFLRWQGGSVASVLTFITADLITFAPLGYLYYMYVQGGNSFTFATDVWIQFGAYSLIAYGLQIFLIVIVDVIAIFSLTA